MKSKRRRIEFQEHVVDDTDDESMPSVRHRHTHIEISDGQVTSQHLLYTMPSSPVATDHCDKREPSGGSAELLTMDTEVNSDETGVHGEDSKRVVRVVCHNNELCTNKGFG